MLGRWRDGLWSECCGRRVALGGGGGSRMGRAVVGLRSEGVLVGWAGRRSCSESELGEIMSPRAIAHPSPPRGHRPQLDVAFSSFFDRYMTVT